MTHVICFSGGKDSAALLCVAEETFDSYFVAICNTHWEHEITEQYWLEILAQLKRCSGHKILSNPDYPNGMRDLVQIKGRVPSAKARFCTDKLKIVPMQEWLKTLDDEFTVYQGIRRDESESRMKMEPREWSDIYDCYVERPLFYWSAEQCFEKIKAFGLRPNPLYLLGASRVGCFPCVLINHRELKAYLSNPSLSALLKERIFELEALCGRTFFPPNYIPKRFHTGHDPKSGKTFCWAVDVFKYIESVDENQLPMLPVRSCMSVYNLCE